MFVSNMVHVDNANPARLLGPARELHRDSTPRSPRLVTPYVARQSSPKNGLGALAGPPFEGSLSVRLPAFWLKAVKSL